MPTTPANAAEEDGTASDHSASRFAQPSGLLRWKRGHELPPFTSSNLAAVQLCESILSGTVDELPAIVVSEAVVQIYQLVVVEKALSQCKGKGATVYAILASLAHRRVMALDPAAADRLDKVLGRKSTASHKTAPGLWPALRALAMDRRRDPLKEMTEMTLEEATQHLLKRWDLQPLAFEFSVIAGGGGGGGEPDGGNRRRQLDVGETNTRLAVSSSCRVAK